MVTALDVGTNTYQLQASANTLLGDNIGTAAWLSVGSADKDRALITAFNTLEGLIWQGTKTGDAQHPRTGLTNCNGDDVSSGSTAPDILLAQAMLAYEYSQDATLATPSGNGAQVKAAKAGSAKVEFFQLSGSRSSPTSALARLPIAVRELVKCYTQSGNTLAAPTATGTSQASSFCSDDDEFNEGLA